MSINPFSYGKPIDDPERLVGRRREIEQIYSRLLSAFESSSIVGERRMGKTSLLKVLSHPGMQAKYGLDPEKYTFIYQDFQFLEAGTIPTRFWKRVLRSIKRSVKGYEDVVDEIEDALNQDTIDNYTLDDIFTLVDDEELYIVLLLDEFENVTRNQNFDNDFFAGLRALAIHHNLALITSSRQELVDLTHSEKVRSSPFFNIFASINLRSFSETDATELIDRYLPDTGVKFLLSELSTIFAVAGFHPYFLQMACHHLFAAHQQGLDDAARRRYLLEKTRAEADSIFHDYWHNSSASQQILLTVLSLLELQRRAGKDTPARTFHQAFISSSQTGTTPQGGENTLTELMIFYMRADQVMPDLERRGLVIKNPANAAYRLFSCELSEWVTDEIIGDVDDLRGWRDWQKSESLAAVLPTDVQSLLGNLAHRLNPAYRDTLGKWLLEPTTAFASLGLLENCLGVYEEHKVLNRQSDIPSTIEIEEKEEEPLAQVPQGLFARVTQRLDSKKRDEPVELSLDNAIDSLDKQQREEMVYSLKRQLVRYTRNLNKLQEDAAMYGSLSSAPLKLQNEIEEIENTIAEIQEKLDELEQD